MKRTTLILSDSVSFELEQLAAILGVRVADVIFWALEGSTYLRPDKSARTSR